ncbi:MAG: hypothetical protein ETSY1_07320 [Candidatus Entotheonella factor]|uniref:Heparinase II N-terminal domain-containing protein n=1 Tax=Entotheonella factor TaxID=1429438 RepID=W4LVQ4_ENTF1|nr:MAG: hypothetical protein ETSY1_07320 [Candidatus Entotheonella factor]
MTTSLPELSEHLSAFVERLLPRILTQVCRDPGSVSYGAFDRHWWHYKMRDFPSIILQQGGYALSCAAVLPAFAQASDELWQLAAGSCRFWNLRAQKYKAFEEYYPWEEGYPPLAFSTLAIAKMVAQHVIDGEWVYEGLQKSARQLQQRFEARAANQQVAGLAALCWIRRIAPDLVDQEALLQIGDRTLACQHEEGWFIEYGGPDLGYLSVTIDCLWDAFDATGDRRFVEAAAKALAFISHFTVLPNPGAGMHNSRNTDYLVPYGISRFLSEPPYCEMSARVLVDFWGDLHHPRHFLHAIDDRYFCHYIGHSLFRALPLIQRASSTFTKPLKRVPHDVPSRYFAGSGHWLWADAAGRMTALVSGYKGGIATFWFDGVSCSDFGWVIQQGKQQWVSHWWADFWSVQPAENQLVIEGRLVPHREPISTPSKHLIIRGLSFVLGEKMIGWLKEKMIFKEKQTTPYHFRRRIRLLANRVEIEDRVEMPPGGELRRAPRSSKRHVASADSYHWEDLCHCPPQIRRDEQQRREGIYTQITTVYGTSET